MSENKGRIPPQNVDAEASLLGCILIQTSALYNVIDVINVEDFYEKRHQIIYGAILVLFNKQKAIDLITLTNLLKEKGELEVVGGAGYIADLTNMVSTAVNALNYAEVVVEKALRRRLIETGEQIARLSFDESQNDSAQLIDIAETSLFKVAEKNIKSDFVKLDEILSSSFDKLEAMHSGKLQIRGIPTGFKSLDKKLAGLQPSDLIILGARPSMGKTTFALNIAHNVAMGTDLSVLFFSLEMSKEQLAEAMVADEAGIDSWGLRTGNLTDEDFEKLTHAWGALAESNLYIDDTPGLTVMEMRAKARRMAQRNKLGLIVVDYLQLMSGGGRSGGGDGNRVQEISEISRGLKILARELDVPVLALSQLSRTVEQRVPQIPQLSDLRESGSIEQDADIVMFIYREEFYNPDTDRKRITDIFIKKHRNGPTGRIELSFEGNKRRFVDLDLVHDDSEMHG